MKLLASMLAVSLAMSATMAMAQETETTTTTTVTTQTAGQSYILPSGSSYYVVNPNNGIVIGNYAYGQSLAPGYYVVEQSSGRVMATVDTSGALMAFSSIPSTLPQRFLVVNGQVIYFNNDYAYRRAQMDQQIATNYAAGRLTNNQVKELREKLGYIANLETRRKSDLSYSRSTVRDIERKFSEIQGSMARYIADTNTRKAKIGLRVD